MNRNYNTLSVYVIIIIIIIISSRLLCAIGQFLMRSTWLDLLITLKLRLKRAIAADKNQRRKNVRPVLRKKIRNEYAFLTSVIN